MSSALTTSRSSERNTRAIGKKRYPSAMRGMSPPGTSTYPAPRSVASAPSAPPDAITISGSRRASAASAADRTSAVFPEYETATTSASFPATDGSP
jgi:hypothetical protein